MVDKKDDNLDDVRRDDEVKIVRGENRRDDTRAERRRDYSRRDYQNGGGLGWLWAILGILALLLLGWIAYSLATGDGLNINQQQQQQQEQNQEERFEEERRTGNFEKSVPQNTETLPEPPVAVIVQTNSPSSTNSNLTIRNNGQEFSEGQTRILGDGLILSRAMRTDSPDGIYTVNYRTCGRDGNCQEGSYQFRVNWNAREGYNDLTGRSTVNVSYDGRAFNPEKMILSRGTRVTWINNSGGEITLRSEDIRVNELLPSVGATIPRNGSISFTFDRFGSYPYRLKLNEKEVSGIIIVQ